MKKLVLSLYTLIHEISGKEKSKGTPKTINHLTIIENHYFSAENITVNTSQPTTISNAAQVNIQGGEINLGNTESILMNNSKVHTINTIDIHIKNSQISNLETINCNMEDNEISEVHIENYNVSEQLSSLVPQEDEILRENQDTQEEKNSVLTNNPQQHPEESYNYDNITNSESSSNFSYTELDKNARDRQYSIEDHFSPISSINNTLSRRSSDEDNNMLNDNITDGNFVQQKKNLLI